MPDRCQELRPSLDALVDGELAPELRDAVEAHLATCAACASERSRLERLDARLRAPVVAMPTAAEWQTLVARARRRPTTGAPPYRLLAAAVLLAVALPTVLGLTLQPRRPCRCDLISPRPNAAMEL